MKIIGNKDDVFFLLYLQQVVFSKYEENIQLFLLKQGMDIDKIEGLLFLLKAISFEVNEREYSILNLTLQEERRGCGTKLTWQRQEELSLENLHFYVINRCLNTQ